MMVAMHSSFDETQRRLQVAKSGSDPDADATERLPHADAVGPREGVQQILNGLDDIQQRMEALTRRVDRLPGYGTVVGAVVAMHLATFALIGIGIAIVYVWRGLPE